MVCSRGHTERDLPLGPPPAARGRDWQREPRKPTAGRITRALRSPFLDARLPSPLRTPLLRPALAWGVRLLGQATTRPGPLSPRPKGRGSACPLGAESPLGTPRRGRRWKLSWAAVTEPGHRDRRVANGDPPERNRLPMLQRWSREDRQRFAAAGAAVPPIRAT
jgi:hypothetical protein